MSNMSFYSTQAVNSLMWLEDELIRDFMAVLVICKTDEDWIKSEVAIVWTTMPPLLVYGKKIHRSRASNSKENIPIWPEIKLLRDFIAVLVTCKFEKLPIKIKSLSIGQGQLWAFSALKGK